MIKKIYILFALIICTNSKLLFAQNTAKDSLPYFQQTVNYNIDVTLIDSTNLLKGFITIDYTNNSQDTLQSIYMHLYPNAYKNDKTAFNKQQVRNGNTKFYFSKANEKGYIKDIAFKVNNILVNTSEADGQADVVLIDLPSMLLPKQTITITTPFTVKIPKNFSRFGGNKQNDYQITQWYPKPAVYDKYGWHPQPYLDQGEFYSEFGKFTVNITLPQNYIVAATGVLQNESEKKWLEQFIVNNSLSDVQRDSLTNRVIPNSNQQKTITFVQDSIHDFAWFANKNFIIEKSNITIADKNIETYIYYLPQHHFNWSGQCDAINYTLQYLSNHVGNYPYSHASVVDGDLFAGGGMEYPMVTVINNMPISYLSEVIYHEVGHNWFQGILASNERQYTFMDEGFNSFYENNITHQVLLDTLATDTINNYYSTFLKAKGATHDATSVINQSLYNNDQSLYLGADEYSYTNYGAMCYGKTAAILGHLQNYLGEEDFEKCMKIYYAQWHHRHPYPADVRKIFEEHSAKNTTWFWQNILPTTNKLDFAIKSVVKNKDGYTIKIKNKTGTLAPVQLQAKVQDKVVYRLAIQPFSQSAETNIPITNFDKIVIDYYKKTTDINKRNNIYYKHGLMHKNRFNINFKLNAPISYKHELFVLPSAGYNNYDGILAGCLIHNASTSQNKFRFLAMPQFGLYSKKLEGMAALGYAWYPTNRFKTIQLLVHGSQYAYNTSKQNIDTRLFNQFTRIAPQIKFIFKNKTYNNAIENKLSYQHIMIWKNEFAYSRDTLPTRPIGYTNLKDAIAKLQFSHTNDRTMNPFGYKITAEGNKMFAKLSAEGTIKAHYNMPNKGLTVRTFLGKFYNFATNPYDAYDYRLAGTHTAENDYTFSNYYIGRSAFNAQPLTQQITENEGGMKLTSNYLASKIGMSDNYMVAINLKSDLPIRKKLPIAIRPFVDFIAYKNSSISTVEALQTSFDAGIQFSVLKDKIILNVPLLMSKDYTEYFKSTFAKKDIWKQQLTFSVLINNWDLYSFNNK